jgi:sugar O-acyltransferase (sialic acid O-acetyltransferase NeuD family)
MMMLVIYGAGGFGREVMDAARRINERHARWEGIAFLDDRVTEPTIYGAEVLSLSHAVERFGNTRLEAVIATGEPYVRKALREKLEAANVRMATLIDDATVVSPSSEISAGAVILCGCYVSSGAKLGANVAVVAGSLIGHDTVIGDDTVISGHVNIGGCSTIGSLSYVGMGVQVKDQTKIGSSSIVGMGSIVCKDIPDDVVALGNPCRPMQPNTDKRVFK